MRVGLLGGTFDPIHLGHLEAAAAALDCGDLDQILLVPAGRPPHKRGVHASAGDRLEMCRLAANGHDRVEVWDWEALRPGPSYTVDTLREFRRSRPSDDPFLVLGWDAARELRHWREPERVVALAGLVVVTRPRLRTPGEAELAAAGADPARTTLCSVRTADVAATRIRRLAAAGRSLDGLVDPAVERFIRDRHLYRAP